MLTDEGRQEVNDEVMKRDTIHGSYRWISNRRDKSSGRVFALAEQWNQLDDRRPAAAWTWWRCCIQSTSHTSTSAG